MRTTTRGSRRLVRGFFRRSSLARSRVHSNVHGKLTTHKVFPMFYMYTNGSVKMHHLVRFLNGIIPFISRVPGMAGATKGRVTPSMGNPASLCFFGADIRPRVNRMSCFGMVDKGMRRNSSLLGTSHNSGRHVTRLCMITNSGHIGMRRLYTNSVNTAMGLGSMGANGALGKGSYSGGFGFVGCPGSGCSHTVGPIGRTSIRGVVDVLGHVHRRSPA